MLLSHFYTTTFRPKAVLTKSKTRVEVFDLGLRLMEKMSPGIELEAITEKTLSDLHAFAIKLGHAKIHVNQVYGGLRVIVRAWNPDALDSSRSRNDALPPTLPGSVREYAEAVYIPQAMIGCTAGAVQKTRVAIASLSEHYGRDVLLTELNDSLAAEHLKWLVALGKAASTINSGYRAPLFAVWNHAVSNGVLDRPPRVKKLKEDRDEPDSLSIDQVRRLFEAAERFRPGLKYGAIPCELFWPALLRTLWWTGLRRAALLSIECRNVDLDQGILSIPPDKMKNKRGKTYRLGADAVEAIAGIMLPVRDKLFETGFNPNTLGRHLRSLMLEAGIRPSRRKNSNLFHMLRRTVATHVAVKSGIHTASSLMGHSGEYVTKVYIDPSKLPGHSALEHLPMIGSAPTPTPLPKQLAAVKRKQTPQPTESEPRCSWEVAQQATELLAGGFHLPAGMMARLAVEKLLLELAATHKIHVQGKRGHTLNNYQRIRSLLLAGVIDGKRQLQFQRLLDFANKLVHGSLQSRELIADLVIEVNGLFASEVPPTLRIARDAG
ncbi:MAG: site-specific integrase [Pirellulales bacterium]